jgi:membrane protease YdiL (CAAX protease family)
MASFRRFLQRHSLIAGLVLMFALTWPIELANAGVLPLALPFAVYILVGWGIVVAALLMTGLTQGKAAVVSLLKRYLLWRVRWTWYLAALLLLPALQLLSVPLTAWLTGVPADFSRPMLRDIAPLDAPLLLFVVPWFVFELLTNGEEIGWRGYVLPRLQARHSALVASLIVGVIWGVWHLPKFLGTGASGERSFVWFVIAHMALSVLYTWLYNNTAGSLLLVTLLHASGNTAALFLPFSFAAAGGLTSNLLIVLYILAAIVVTVAAGPADLSRTKDRQIQE